MFSDIELRTGVQRWQLPVTSVSTPWPAGDVVFVTDTAGEVICASRDSGAIYWITDLNKGAKKKKDRGLWSGPILASDEQRGFSPKSAALRVLELLGARAWI